MTKSRARRYSIEVKDSNGSVLFATVAYWNDKDRRVALAQITGLSGLPEVNFRGEPALEPEASKARSAADRSKTKTARSAPR